MKALVNRRTVTRNSASKNSRITVRNKQKRYGPKPVTYVAHVRQQPDGRMVVDLPDAVCTYLGVKIGARIWFYLDGNGVHLTERPWGPYGGRRQSVRVRKSSIPLRYARSMRTQPQSRFKRLKSGEKHIDPDG